MRQVLKMQLMNFIQDLGVRIIGGCCGTTPEHIKALVDNMLVKEKRHIFNKKSKP